MKILNEEVNDEDIVLLVTDLDSEYLGIFETTTTSFNKIMGIDFMLRIYNGSEDIEKFKIKDIKDIKVLHRTNQ